VLLQKRPDRQKGPFLWLKMRNIEDQTDEILFDLSAENRYNRVRELLSKENQLIQAKLIY